MSVYICPHCQRPIYDEEALLCHFCGESLGRSGPGLLGKMTGAKGKWVLILVGTLVIVSFLSLLFH